MKDSKSMKSVVTPGLSATNKRRKKGSSTIRSSAEMMTSGDALAQNKTEVTAIIKEEGINVGEVVIMAAEGLQIPIREELPTLTTISNISADRRKTENISMTETPAMRVTGIRILKAALGTIRTTIRNVSLPAH